MCQYDQRALLALLNAANIIIVLVLEAVQAVQNVQGALFCLAAIKYCTAHMLFQIPVICQQQACVVQSPAISSLCLLLFALFQRLSAAAVPASTPMRIASSIARWLSTSYTPCQCARLFCWFLLPSSFLFHALLHYSLHSGSASSPNHSSIRFSCASLNKGLKYIVVFQHIRFSAFLSCSLSASFNISSFVLTFFSFSSYMVFTAHNAHVIRLPAPAMRRPQMLL